MAGFFAEVKVRRRASITEDCNGKNAETHPTVENMSSAFHFESGKFLSFQNKNNKLPSFANILMTVEFEMTPKVLIPSFEMPLI